MERSGPATTPGATHADAPTSETLQAILDKSRGTQLSIQGMKVVWLCPDCDAEKLRRWLDSNVPLPPDDLPVDPR